jgi:hypothetical protein
MDTKPTEETMREMADRMRYYADEVDRCADKLEKSGDFHYAAEAISCITNMMTNIRIDLLVTRPIRAMGCDE